MTLPRRYLRRAAGFCAGLLVLGLFGGTSAQEPAAIPYRNITFILPTWGGYLSATDTEFAAEVQELRARIGENARVRVGFTVYVTIEMTNWDVDVANADAVAHEVRGTINTMDAVIARARTHGIPLGIALATPVRAAYDAAQRTSEGEDRRNMQWHADNSLAAGWWSYSQYARKQRLVQEAYVRAVGRALAARITAYPETVVAANGDGEIELSYEKSDAQAPNEALLADFSPFAVAEFRDWLKADGLFAAGQPLAGKAYEFSARYAGDASPATDTNSDGHTLNGDFQTSFTTWDLLHFNWSLGDAVLADPNAIPAAEYQLSDWNALPNDTPGGFDPPRMRLRGNAWWDVWNLFRQTMVQRHNTDFAKWITTSADPISGRTVPNERWFSNQIPADYLFGHTPSNPNFRLDTSASPHWTADVSPYGSIGITAFNHNWNFAPPTPNAWAKTLENVAPQIAARGVRWGITEWNPSLPATDDPTVYREEMAIVERYRPAVLTPLVWRHDYYKVDGSGFEVALKELVDSLGTVPLTLSQSTLHAGAVSNGSAVTPVQVIRVSGAAGERTPAWTISAASTTLNVQVIDGTSFSVQPHALAWPAGDYVETVTVSSTDPSYSPATLTVRLKVSDPGQTTPPVGAFDTPAAAAVVRGEVAVTGWVIDDVGVASLQIFREAVEGEAAGLKFIGNATFVEGARPDIASGNPDKPLSARAGWGYMLLSNFLPNGGNGPIVLHAIATDQDGHTVTLGTRPIVASNTDADLPFGTIDTPAQGETVSGVVTNWGWALAQKGVASIPADGSTIAIYVDNVFVGRPTEYGLNRPDIAALFPGYANTNSSAGYFLLDTTTLTNGVHTIAWVVTDNLGRAQGIGSRFFTVFNP